ncbi:nuclear transport factor 2 family protein [Trujillonella endophytica]|uniref:SnoaL-like domain-containing protein n=1 Tax=Trujillonella endophytica TaxID=673521 RepID=A0A1H8QRA4_9ACTN|nr:nuclear transport factor 2 family protein [Trujillella endophytica]SEO56745.1 SnoaL-like domain-containing protein [Trujillella endophytica]
MTLSDAEIADLRRLLEVQAIHEVMLRYARAVDRADSDLMDSIFWPEGTDNHGMYEGDAAGFFDRARAARGDTERARHHLIGVPRILSREGDQTRVETYFIFTGVYGAGANDNLGDVKEATVGFNWGRYRDLFEKRDGEWKVLHRVTVYDVVLAQPYDPAFDFFNIPLGINRGAVEPRDATYESEW